MLQSVPGGLTLAFDDRLDPEPLIHSLQTALESFPIVAGRLRLHNKKLIIDCKHQGISTSIVEIDQELVEILNNLAAGKSDNICEIIIPRRALKGKSPLMTVRFNQPKDRGTILGIGWHHSVGDMATLMEFLSAWASLSRDETFRKPIITLDRHTTFVESINGRGPAISSIRKMRGLELVRFLAYMLFRAKKQQAANFYFSNAELNAMRKDLSEKAGQRLSKNDALCAHLAANILPLDPLKRSHTLTLSVNWRPFLNMPAQLLGNFIGSISLPVAHHTDSAELAHRIRHSVDNSIDAHLDYLANHEEMERGGGHSAATKHISLGINPMNGTLLITSWCGFGLPELKFQGHPCSNFHSIRPPIPWLSSIFEGPRHEGMCFSIFLPQAMGKSLKSAENVDRVHKYRTIDDSIPPEISRLKAWL
jgi:hypothetical protein